MMFSVAKSQFAPTVCDSANRPVYSHSPGPNSLVISGNVPTTDGSRPSNSCGKRIAVVRPQISHANKRRFTAQSNCQSAHGPTPLTRQVKRNGSSTGQTLPLSSASLPSSTTMTTSSAMTSSLPSTQGSSTTTNQNGTRKANEKSEVVLPMETIRAPRRGQKYRSYYNYVFFNITTLDRIPVVRPHVCEKMVRKRTKTFRKSPGCLNITPSS